MKPVQSGKTRSKINISPNLKTILGKGSPNTKENLTSIKYNLLKYKKTAENLKKSTHRIGSPTGSTYESNLESYRNFKAKYFNQSNIENGSPNTRSLTPKQKAAKNIINTYSPSQNSKKENVEMNSQQNLIQNSVLMHKISGPTGSPPIKPAKTKSTGRSKSNAQAIFHQINDTRKAKYSIKSSLQDDSMASIQRIPCTSSKAGGSGSGSKNSPLTSPGSPSNYSLSHLLDVNKYRGELFEADGIKVTYTCINHQQKRSKYYIVQDDQLRRATGGNLSFLRGVCSKCAVYLGQLGFKCIEIEFGREKLDLLKSYIKNLEHVEDHQLIVLTQTNEAIANLETHYENEFSALEEFEGSIDKIIKMLNENKSKMRNILISESRKEMEKFTEIKAEIQDNLDFLGATKKDIERNIDPILRDFAIGKIESILSGYSQKLQMISVSTPQTLLSTSVLKINKVDQEEIFEIGSQLSKWFNIEKTDFVMSNSQPALIEHSYNQEAFRDERIGTEDEIDDEDDEPKHAPEHQKGQKNPSEVYVSFDNREKFESAIWNQQSLQSGTYSIDGSESKRPKEQGSTSKYISILDKITESQNEKNDFYATLVGDEQNDEGISSIHSNQSKHGSELSEQEDCPRDFLISIPIDSGQMQNLGTPEWGKSRDDMPEHMKQAFENVKHGVKLNDRHFQSLNNEYKGAQVSHIERSQFNDMLNFITDSTPVDPTYSKCQKILFDGDSGN